MRTSRSNGTTTYQYYYSGDKLTVMTKGSTTLSFTYNAAGNPLTLTYNGTKFYYNTNLQGDVVGIMDSSGATVVTYIYDAWGRPYSTTGSLASTLGADNPLRYRGYVYDSETWFYYLQSRYYSFEWGKFISPDVFTSTGQGLTGNNMFAYCGNNPVSRKDDGGFLWDTVIDIVSLGFSIADAINNPSDPMAWLGVAADVASLLIPCVSGGGALVKGLTKADDVVDLVKTVDHIDNTIDTTKATAKIHGNSLKTTKETIGYALRKNDTQEIMKFGETTRGVKRYSNKFYAENGVYMDPIVSGTKYDMHFWQHNQIIEYTKTHGVRPPWNKSDW